MLAFLLIVLMPAVLFFAFVPVVVCGLMVESVSQRAQTAPARKRAVALEDYRSVSLQDAVPSSA